MTDADNATRRSWRVPNAKLIVTVLPESLDEERDDGARFALQNLARAYGPDEPEYSLDDIKEVNPDYEAR